MEKPIESSSPAQSIPLLCIPDSSTLTWPGAGLSPAILGRQKAKPPKDGHNPKGKKKKKNPEQKAAVAPCPLPADVRWLLPNPPGQAVSPRGDSAVPSPAPCTEGGSQPRSARSRNKAPGREFSSTAMLMSAPGSILPPVANWSENPGLRGCNFYVR